MRIPIEYAPLWQLAKSLLPPGAAALPATGLDALDFVELVLHVEQHFGIRFSPAELHDLHRARQVLDRAGPQRRQLYAEFFAQLLQRSTWR